MFKFSICYDKKTTIKFYTCIKYNNTVIIHRKILSNGIFGIFLFTLSFQFSQLEQNQIHRPSATFCVFRLGEC